MASLDVDFLFTNFPLDETIDIFIDNLYNDNKNPTDIPKHDFRSLLNIATKESFFMFNSKYHKKVNGVALGSPSGLVLADIFTCSLCVVLKVHGFEIPLMISNLCSIGVMLITY